MKGPYNTSAGSWLHRSKKCEKCGEFYTRVPEPGGITDKDGVLWFDCATPGCGGTMTLRPAEPCACGEPCVQSCCGVRRCGNCTSAHMASEFEEHN